MTDGKTEELRLVVDRVKDGNGYPRLVVNTAVKNVKFSAQIGVTYSIPVAKSYRNARVVARITALIGMISFVLITIISIDRFVRDFRGRSRSSLKQVPLV